MAKNAFVVSGAPAHTLRLALVLDFLSLSLARLSVALRIALYTGTGCEKDAKAAKELWQAAEELGIQQAVFCLNNMDEEGVDTLSQQMIKDGD